jgi:hypothetical protein
VLFNWAPRHEGVLGKWRYSPTHSWPDGREWSAPRPGRFTPREWDPGTCWIGGWVGPRTGLDTVVKRKFPVPAGNLNPNHPTRSPTLYHWAIPSKINLYRYILFNKIKIVRPPLCITRIKRRNKYLGWTQVVDWKQLDVRYLMKRLLENAKAKASTECWHLIGS